MVLKFLDKFIDRYVLCKKCRYPELVMKFEGKELKSSCNSCGSTTSHDSQHKAGKALLNHLKQGGGLVTDIQKKVAEKQEATLGGDMQIDMSEDDEILADISDEDKEATFESRRVLSIIDAMQSNLSIEDMSNNIKVRD